MYKLSDLCITGPWSLMGYYVLNEIFVLRFCQFHVYFNF